LNLSPRGHRILVHFGKGLDVPAAALRNELTEGHRVQSTGVLATTVLP